MKNHKLFWGSSYDRGLIHLLRMWPDILEAVPDATLDICYGWVLFLKVFSNNPERMAWHDKVVGLMKQPGITEHGRVGKKELEKIRNACGIWAYPTDFDEINCITALESQRDGLVPVVMNKAALAETVQSGIKIEGDIFIRDTFMEYRDALISLMKDEERWKVESEKAKEFAKSYDWTLLAREWVKEFGYGKP
jgi:glycosyltransferase involved in cell wall biosynthesis